MVRLGPGYIYRLYIHDVPHVPPLKDLSKCVYGHNTCLVKDTSVQPI